VEAELAAHLAAYVRLEEIEHALRALVRAAVLMAALSVARLNTGNVRLRDRGPERCFSTHAGRTEPLFET
jgi:hypothetical protein